MKKMLGVLLAAVIFALGGCGRETQADPVETVVIPPVNMETDDQQEKEPDQEEVSDREEISDHSKTESEEDQEQIV